MLKLRDRSKEVCDAFSNLRAVDVAAGVKKLLHDGCEDAVQIGATSGGSQPVFSVASGRTGGSWIGCPPLGHTARGNYVGPVHTVAIWQNCTAVDPDTPVDTTPSR